MPMQTDTGDNVVKFPRKKKLTPEEQLREAAAGRARARRRSIYVDMVDCAEGCVALGTLYYMNVFVVASHPSANDLLIKLADRLLAGEFVKLSSSEMAAFQVALVSRDHEPASPTSTAS